MKLTFNVHFTVNIPLCRVRKWPSISSFRIYETMTPINHTDVGIRITSMLHLNVLNMITLYQHKIKINIILIRIIVKCYSSLSNRVTLSIQISKYQEIGGCVT